MIEKIPVEGYKQHQGEGDQLSYKGIALTKGEQVAIEKINEVIDMINTVMVNFGINLTEEGNLEEVEDGTTRTQ